MHEYYTDSVDLSDIFDFLADIWIFFYHGWQNWKTTRGAAPGPWRFCLLPRIGSGHATPPRSDGLGSSWVPPRSGAAARRLAKLPGVRRCTPCGYSILPPMVKKSFKILSKKIPDTQVNPRYSAKNNVAIRIIATFIPYLIYFYSSQVLLDIFISCNN